jgi:hypothetical protein
MKKCLIVLLSIVFSIPTFSQTSNIIKTKYNFGAIPFVSFDADKGMQFGAIFTLFNYGDGSSYPDYESKVYVETSFFTKGSKQYSVMYDNKTLIPGIRWSSAIVTTTEKAMDFYGFNGYQAWFDQGRIDLGKVNNIAQDPANYLFTPFYKIERTQVIAKTDFTGNISKHLKWEGGLHFSYFKENAIDRSNINKGKPVYNLFPDSQSTLYEDYLKWGIISEDEAAGGFSNSIRLGLMFDTRDKEGAPTRGIWAESHINAAPGWLGTKNPYTRYTITFRQYFPMVKHDILTFAYRLNYEGTIGNSAPYYVLPYITVMGENSDKDGMGGYRTVRGMLRNRVVGLDMAIYTAELRWRFAKFNSLKQNVSLGLSAFNDGAMVTKGRNMAYRGDLNDNESISAYNTYMAKGKANDTPHMTVGSGLRFIMNENFIVAFEFGTPISHFYKRSSPLYNQDGAGAFYINTGYLF